MAALHRKLRLRLALQNWGFALLAVVLTVLLVMLGQTYRVQYDWTLSGRNSLSQASLETLRRLDGPIRITAYATTQDARFGDLRKLIRDLVQRYQRAKPDIELRFVDPREDPRATAAAGVKVNGELVVEYADRSDRLASLSEHDLTNLLIRLAREQERLVMYLDGHGERSLRGGANHDLGDFGRQLGMRGVAIGSLNLSIAPEVPANVALLVIANPQVPLLAAEVDKIERYLEHGGNLLWLIDQEPLHGLEPIAERLGLLLTPGIVVDPDAIERGGRPVMAVAAAGAYSMHPVTRALRLNTVFPFARAIGLTPDDDWRSTALLEVAARGWIETGSLDGSIVFDQGRDIAGPVVIAYAMERLRDERTQRVIVVGSGHFLANTYLGNGGNLELGLNMVNWLIGDDRLIAIPPRVAPDATLTLSRGWLIMIVFAFLIILPLALICAGGYIWWRRRRA